jgi:hypothetical protein
MSKRKRNQPDEPIDLRLTITGRLIIQRLSMVPPAFLDRLNSNPEDQTIGNMWSRLSLPSSRRTA